MLADKYTPPQTRSMSSMSMDDFKKKLIDLENRVSHSDDFNKKLVDLESKVMGHSTISRSFRIHQIR